MHTGQIDGTGQAMKRLAEVLARLRIARYLLRSAKASALIDESILRHDARSGRVGQHGCRPWASSTACSADTLASLSADRRFPHFLEAQDRQLVDQLARATWAPGYRPFTGNLPDGVRSAVCTSSITLVQSSGAMLPEQARCRIQSVVFTLVTPDLEVSQRCISTSPLQTGCSIPIPDLHLLERPDRLWCIASITMVSIPGRALSRAQIGENIAGSVDGPPEWILSSCSVRPRRSSAPF